MRSGETFDSNSRRKAILPFHNALMLFIKIYKYRDFSNPSETDFCRLGALIHRQLVWCAPPETLNDPEEFLWSCDYTTTVSTSVLLTEVLIRARGRTRANAQKTAEDAVESGRLRGICGPIIRGMMDQCRNEIGLACFGTGPNNETLWNRYGGNGAGVCVEIRVPTDLLGTQLHRVQYFDEKRVHIDQLLRAFVDSRYVQEVYDLALLSKPSSWADEEEIRFVSRAQSVTVAIDRAKVTGVFAGQALRPDVRAKIARLIAPVCVVDRTPPERA